MDLDLPISLPRLVPASTGQKVAAQGGHLGQEGIVPFFLSYPVGPPLSWGTQEIGREGQAQMPSLPALRGTKMK